MKLEKLTPVEIFTLVVSGIGAGISIVNALLDRKARGKLARTNSKLEESIDELVSGGIDTIHIAQSFVDDAIKAKVDREVCRMMPDALNAGRREASRAFTEEVKKEVNNQYADIKKEVMEKVDKEVKKINIDKIREDMVSRGAEYINEKMESDVDRAVNNFKDDLHDIILELKDDAEDTISDRIDEAADQFDDRLSDLIKIYRKVADRISND